MKLNYKQTFLIGFGFFATSIAWSIYNGYVPPMLNQLGISSTLVGFIMSIDNIFGVVFQPTFGALSDRTCTRFGRRMPFIFIGIPLCAALFALVPSMSGQLWTLMATVIAFNFIMSTWRAPVVALMPDLTPAPLRSKANGIINLMGGVGSLIAFVIGGQLANMAGDGAPFYLSSIVMLAALLVLVFFVREPSLAPRAELWQGQDDKPVPKKEEEHFTLSRGEKISLGLMLAAIFFWFAGYNAVETFYTLYATSTLHMASGELVSTGSATMLLAFFSVSFIAVALPAGILGGKIGRRRTILIGLVGVTALFIPMFFVKDLMMLRVLLLLGGAFWAFVNINSLPMVVELAGHARIGTFTGYYYVASFSAAIVSPILFGFIHDLTKNYSLIFIYAAVAFVLAIACMAFVRHGESAPEHKVGAMDALAMSDD